MLILLFVFVPLALVSAYAFYGWYKTREPSSVESGIDAFRREMTALSPDAAPVHRRPERPTPPEGTGGPADDETRLPTSSRSAPPADESPRQSPRRPGSDDAAAEPETEA